MNIRVKQKWIEALRSGDYPQAQRKLRSDDRFCVYGVLCDIYSKEFGVGWKGNAFLDCGTIPPIAVLRWADFPKTFLRYNVPASMNDSGSSFAMIADWIEKNL